MNLYLRLLWTWLRSHLKPPIRFGDAIELRLRVWPNDLDVNGHMNNGRYMTVTDLAVIEYFARAGVLKVLLSKGWRPVLGGAMISFRRSLKNCNAKTGRTPDKSGDWRMSHFHSLNFAHERIAPI